MTHRLTPRSRFGFAFVAMLLMVTVSARAEVGSDLNLVRNGGFEGGTSGWMYQQWKNKPLPGYVDKDDMAEGLASFKMHQDDIDQELYMAREVKLPAGANQDYTLSITLSAQDMPPRAGRVRVLIDGYGWLNKTTGRMDLVHIGGNEPWKAYVANIPAELLAKAEKLTVYIYHDHPQRGTLGIDAVRLSPGTAPTPTVQPEAPAPTQPNVARQPDVQPKTRSQSEAAPPRGTLKDVTYSVASPVVLAPRSDATVAIEVAPEKTLYRPDEMPRVTVRSVQAVGATVVGEVHDGFGNVLTRREVPADGNALLELSLPPNHGYYEIVATLQRDNVSLGEARHSVGVLPPPARPIGDDPFGMWIQGDEHYPELGVRWTRSGLYWQSYQAQGDAYLQNRRELFQRYHDQHIKVIAYPKHPHPHQTSREVIEDTPEAWRDLEAWWTTMVRELADEVDAWAVVNEPMAGHWKGDDELIVRYWALMRKIVDQYDPSAPLLGPSLSPNTPSLVAQYQRLLDMGFGQYIDVVEMHTYITSPEDNDWEGNTRRIREMTREATGKDLPIWSTEHGSTASHENELRQAQHLMRSWLVAEKIGYPVMIWHMFSHPQGTDEREVQFATFRNARRGEAPPQPRPAGLAYGVMTRQLAGATYRGELDYLGPSINAYVFERDGQAMLAVWTTSQKTYDVSLALGDHDQVTQTGLFGREQSLPVHDGLVSLTVDRNPRFIAPLPDFYLDTQPIVTLDGTVEVLPGQAGQAQLTLSNPKPGQAELRIEWLGSEGWRLSTPQDDWSLEGEQRVTTPLMVTPPADAALGQHQLYGKVFLDGRYVTAAAVSVRVLPQVELVEVKPDFDASGRPVLAGQLRRLDPSLESATVQVGDGRSEDVEVQFPAGDMAMFTVPVGDPARDHLETLELRVLGAGGDVQATERLQLSFVPVTRLRDGRVIDGDLRDWQNVSDSIAPAIRWGWDAQHLYLAVRVEDPRHIQDQTVTEMWKDDSLQIAVAPSTTDQLIRDYLPGLQESNMMEFDLALRSDGPAMYRHRTMNKHAAPVGEVGQNAIHYAARHHDGVTEYELQIPVDQLGLRELSAGQLLRASLLINANEGGGREIREWFGGINAAKDPDLFGHLILTP